MIYISTLKPSKVILTLAEHTPFKDPYIHPSYAPTEYYTWKITNRDTFEETIFSPDDFSDSPYYDAFTISVGLTVSLTSSVCLNIHPAQYDFAVYQMPTNHNLDLSQANFMAESGILQVVGPDFSYVHPQLDPIAFTASDSDTIKAFTEL